MESVFLDANVLFSAAYREDSGLRALWRTTIDLVTSDLAAREARENLRLERSDAAAKLARLERLLESVRIVSTPVDRPLTGIDLSTNDRLVLLAAIHASASRFLTGDVRDFGRWYGRSIAQRPSAEALRWHAEHTFR